MSPAEAEIAHYTDLLHRLDAVLETAKAAYELEHGTIAAAPAADYYTARTTLLGLQARVTAFGPSFAEPYHKTISTVARQALETDLDVLRHQIARVQNAAIGIDPDRA